MKDLSELERLNLAAKAEAGTQFWFSVFLLLFYCAWLAGDLLRQLSRHRDDYALWSLIAFCIFAAAAQVRVIVIWVEAKLKAGFAEKTLVEKWASNLSGSVIVVRNFVQFESGSFWTGYRTARLAREGDWLFVAVFRQKRLERPISLHVLDASTAQVKLNEECLEVGALRFKNVKNASERLHQLGSVLQLSTAGA